MHVLHGLLALACLLFPAFILSEDRRLVSGAIASLMGSAR